MDVILIYEFTRLLITGTVTGSADKFGMYDKNKDGFINKTELGNYLVTLNKDASEPDLDVSFNKL